MLKSKQEKCVDTCQLEEQEISRKRWPGESSSCWAEHQCGWVLFMILSQHPILTMIYHVSWKTIKWSETNKKYIVVFLSALNSLWGSADCGCVLLSVRFIPSGKHGVDPHDGEEIGRVLPCCLFSLFVVVIYYFNRLRPPFKSAFNSLSLSTDDRSACKMHFVIR